MTEAASSPSAEALKIAGDHVRWLQRAYPGLGPGEFLLCACGAAWPHQRDVSWNDVTLCLAGWLDQFRREAEIIAARPKRGARESAPPILLDRKVVLFPKARGRTTKRRKVA